jgi:chromosome segregation ATPase
MTSQRWKACYTRIHARLGPVNRAHRGRPSRTRSRRRSGRWALARTAVEELQKTASTLEAATAEIAAAPPTVRRDDLASGIADLVALCKAKDAEVAATKRTSEEQQRTIEQLRSELGEGASQTDTLGQALAALQAAAQNACNTLEPTATPTRGKPVEPKQLTAAAQRAREALTSTEAQLEEARSEVEQERKRLEQLRDDIAAVEGVLHTHPRSPGARESSPSRSTVKDAEQATQRTMGAARTAVEELQKTASTLEAATAEIAAAPPTVRRDDLASGIADLVALCKAKDAEVAATKRTNEEQQRTIEQLRRRAGRRRIADGHAGASSRGPPGGGAERMQHAGTDGHADAREAGRAEAADGCGTASA